VLTKLTRDHVDGFHKRLPILFLRPERAIHARTDITSTRTSPRATIETKRFISSARSASFVPTIPFDHSIETTSPRQRAILVRERTRQTVRPEKREAHGLTCRLLDRACPFEVIEVR
jgi:hypothetical protein